MQLQEYESETLGLLSFTTVDGVTFMQTQVKFDAKLLPLRLELAFPDRLSENTVADIDRAITQLSFIDTLCRETIRAGVDQKGSTAQDLYDIWLNVKPMGWENSAHEFTSNLELMSLYLMPDGGYDIPDRIICSYELKEGSSHGQVKVRLLEPTGPQLA